MQIQDLKLKTLVLIDTYGELLIAGNLTNDENLNKIKLLHISLREGSAEVLKEFSEYMSIYLQKDKIRLHQVTNAFMQAEKEYYPAEYLKKDAKDSFFKNLLKLSGHENAKSAVVEQYLNNIPTEKTASSQEELKEFKKKLPEIQKQKNKLNKADEDAHADYIKVFIVNVIRKLKEGVIVKGTQSLSVFEHVKNLKHHANAVFFDYVQGATEFNKVYGYFTGTKEMSSLTDFLLILKFAHKFEQTNKYLDICNTIVNFLTPVIDVISDDNSIEQPIKKACIDARKEVLGKMDLLNAQLRELGFSPDRAFEESKLFSSDKQAEQVSKEEKLDPRMAKNLMLVNLIKTQEKKVEKDNSFDTLQLSKDDFKGVEEKFSNSKGSIGGSAVINSNKSVGNGHANNPATAANSNAQNLKKPPIAAPKKGFVVGMMGELAAKIGVKNPAAQGQEKKDVPSVLTASNGAPTKELPALPPGSAKNAAAVKSPVFTAPQANTNKGVSTDVSSKKDVADEFDDFVMLEVSEAPSNSKM